MKSKLALLTVLLGALAFVGAAPGAGALATQCAPPAGYPAAQTPVAFWSTEARCAIVPAGPGGIFGAENYGNKFPGEAAVYMGIVHAAIYDAAVAIEGGYRPYAFTLTAPADTSPEAAIATAATTRSIGLQPALGLTAASWRSSTATTPPTSRPSRTARRRRTASRSERRSPRRCSPGARTTAVGVARRSQVLGQPAPGPGVWQPNATGPVLGLRLPGMRPLALRECVAVPSGRPYPLTSRAYADDFDQVKELGRDDSTSRTPEQTAQARFWTDHDLRQWNDGMLRLAADRGLDLVQTARMLAMAHVAGGDAMIACFDAKYHYWFWRPFQAIPQADTDGNPATRRRSELAAARCDAELPRVPVGARLPQRGGRRGPCTSFFGTDRVPFSLDSRITHATRQYERLHDVVDDVDAARVLVGFHFLNSDLHGSKLGRRVGDTSPTTTSGRPADAPGHGGATRPAG